jgi:hypothetical protein
MTHPDVLRSLDSSWALRAMRGELRPRALRPRSPRVPHSRCLQFLALILAPFLAPFGTALALFAPAPAHAQSAAAERADLLTGSWGFEVVTENGTGYPTVTLTQTGDSITGAYASERMGSRPLAGVVRGDSLVFQLATDPSAGVVMTFSGVRLPDGSLRGIVDFGGMGGATFTARRLPPPARQPRVLPVLRDPREVPDGA